MVEIGKYLDIVLPGKADKTIAEEAKRSEPKRDMFNIYIAAFLALLGAFASRGWIEGTLDSVATSTEAISVFNPVANPVSAALTFMIAAVVAVVSIWLLHWLVSGLGGKGNYSNLFHVLSIFLVSEGAYSLIRNAIITTISIPFGAGTAICTVGFISGIISLYFIYMTYLIIRNVYGEIKTMNIALAMVGWYITLIIISFAMGSIRASVGI